MLSSVSNKWKWTTELFVKFNLKKKPDVSKALRIEFVSRCSTCYQGQISVFFVIGKTGWTMRWAIISGWTVNGVSHSPDIGSQLPLAGSQTSARTLGTLHLAGWYQEIFNAHPRHCPGGRDPRLTSHFKGAAARVLSSFSPAVSYRESITPILVERVKAVHHWDFHPHLNAVSMTE